MRILVMKFNNAMQRTWTVDEDCVLVGAQTPGGNVLISEDPQLTLNNVITPTVAESAMAIFLWLSSGGAAGAAIYFPTKIPLQVSRQLYVTSGQATTVALFLDSP